VEPVAEAPDWLADVDTGPAKPIGALPTAPKKTAASPKVAKAHPVSKPKKPAKVRAVAEPLEIEVVEDADAPPGFELRMRDFLVFGLGALTVAVAVGLGVFLANRAFSKREPIEPEPQPQIQAPPHQSPPQVQPQPEPQPQVEPQPEPPPPPAPKNDPDDAK
jgi:hypothetical protein